MNRESPALWDGWGNRYRAVYDRSMAAIDHELWRGPTAEPEADTVLANGGFVPWPRGSRP